MSNPFAPRHYRDSDIPLLTPFLEEIIDNDYLNREQFLADDQILHGKAMVFDGHLNFKNGNTYEGHILNGTLHGHGQLKFPDNSLYTGSFKSNTITGQGLFCWPNGSHYIGDFLTGLRHGQGEFHSPKL